MAFQEPGSPAQGLGSSRPAGQGGDREQSGANVPKGGNHSRSIVFVPKIISGAASLSEKGSKPWQGQLHQPRVSFAVLALALAPRTWGSVSSGGPDWALGVTGTFWHPSTVPEPTLPANRSWEWAAACSKGLTEPQPQDSSVPCFYSSRVYWGMWGTHNTENRNKHAQGGGGGRPEGSEAPADLPGGLRGPVWTKGPSSPHRPTVCGRRWVGAERRGGREHLGFRLDFGNPSTWGEQLREGCRDSGLARPGRDDASTPAAPSCGDPSRQGRAAGVWGPSGCGPPSGPLLLENRFPGHYICVSSTSVCELQPGSDAEPLVPGDPLPRSLLEIPGSWGTGWEAGLAKEHRCSELGLGSLQGLGRAEPRRWCMEPGARRGGPSGQGGQLSSRAESRPRRPLTFSRGTETSPSAQLQAGGRAGGQPPRAGAADK